MLVNPICLITPPSAFLLDERVLLTLGILRVAACLERDGYKVEMLDLSGIENYEESAKLHASRTEAMIFGLTATTPQMPAAAKIVRAIRQVRPNVRIILGGPHVTLVYAALRRERKLAVEGRASRAFFKLAEMFDVLVVGDGDDAIFAAIASDAPKVVDADDPKSNLFLTNKRYNEIPFPARHLVDVSSYHFTIDGQNALSMISQLGCPFHCCFCGGRESPMLRRIRSRTTDSIIAEVLHLVNVYGARAIMFYDDELGIQQKPFIELMNRIADMKLGLRFRGFVKAELFTEAQAESMYRAGFRWVLCGFESGSPRILENIRKQATRDDNTRALRIAHANGIKVKALMSIGHAGESVETIRETKEWLLAEKPDDFDCTIITVYAGTPYHDDAVETEPGIWTYTARNGDRLYSQEVDFTSDGGYYKGKIGEYKSFVWTDYIGADELVVQRDMLENEVREKLGVPFNAGHPGVRYEASIGQLPGFMLRRTEGVPVS